MGLLCSLTKSVQNVWQIGVCHHLLGLNALLNGEARCYPYTSASWVSPRYATEVRSRAAGRASRPSLTPTVSSDEQGSRSATAGGWMGLDRLSTLVRRWRVEEIVHLQLFV